MPEPCKTLAEALVALQAQLPRIPKTDLTPEDKHGSSNSRQHQVLGILYAKLGITERESRLTDMTDRVGRTITSAKDLSFVEASKAIGELTELAEGEH